MHLGKNPNKQQVLNFVFYSMKSQGRLSYNPVGNDSTAYPRYKDSTGARCPIGHILQDSHLISEFDGLYCSRSIADLSFNGHLVGELAWMNAPDMLGFLQDVQEAHDQSEDFKDWITQITLVTNHYKLVVPHEMFKENANVSL